MRAIAIFPDVDLSNVTTVAASSGRSWHFVRLGTQPPRPQPSTGGSIAGAHRATIVLDDNHPGVRMMMRFERTAR